MIHDISDKTCRLAVACLEETLAHFIAALLTYTKSITDVFLKQLQCDYDLICDFFEKHCIKEKVSSPSTQSNFIFTCHDHVESCYDPHAVLLSFGRNSLRPVTHTLQHGQMKNHEREVR